MKYFKLLKGINQGKIVMVHSNIYDEHFEYNFIKNLWQKTNIFSDFIWFDNEKFEKFNELNESQVKNLLDIQRQQLMSLLRLAEVTASEAHKGQVDMGGHPYINHPKYVANSVDCLEQKIIAWLHDILEDTKITEDDLRKMGFTESIIYSVKLLTKSKNIDYEEYLWHIKTDANAKTVKLADLEHNMDTTRLGRKLKPKDIERLKKYKHAVTFIK